MAKKFPLHPKHPERICWGCDKYCPVDSLECGNGSDRTQHPVELLGEDWLQHGDWGIDTGTESSRINDAALSQSEKRQDRQDDNDQADDVDNVVHEFVSVWVK